MKAILKKIIFFLLLKRAKKIMNSRTEVIAITGSMGKTTTKNILTQLLSLKYSVLSSKGGFNTPIGILLSLLGEEKSGFSSPLEWLKILIRVYTKKLIIPQKIVLEYGVDRVGDMTELLSLLKPHIAILTNITSVHLGEKKFRNEQEIFSEKSKLAKSLPSDGICFLGEDDIFDDLAPSISAKVFRFGNGTDMNISILDYRLEHNGISFVYSSSGEREEYFIPVFADYIPSLAAPAIFLARKYGISHEKIQASFLKFLPPAGRGRVFKGIMGSTIFDSSYNSNPRAVKNVLQTVSRIVADRKIVVLGQMNELGENEMKFHTQMGETAEKSADIIYFVGEEKYFQAFKKGVIKKKVEYFKNPFLAGKALINLLQKNDLVVFKGSQGGVFLEKAIEKILQNKDDISKLCRRGQQWEKITFQLQENT